MAWLTGWTYRKKVTITGQSGAGTNYQVLFKVGETSGATGEDFDLEGNSTSFPTGKDVGGDLRFTAADGTTLLDFWVEKITGTTPNILAYIWVEVSADLGSNQDIYCYYGNAGASDYSDGDDTFVFYSGFDGGSIDTAKWNTALQVGTWSISAGRLKGTDASTFRLPSKNPVLSGMSTWAIEWIGEGSTNYAVAVCSKVDNTGLFTSGYHTLATIPLDLIYIYNEGAGNSGGAYNYLTNTKYKAKQFYDGTNLEFKVYLEDGETLASEYSIADGTPPANNYIAPRATGGITYWEDLFVRKYLATEPTYSSTNSEESLQLVELSDTINLSDASNYPEAILADTITISDSLINDIAHYATKIIRLDSTNMLIVTDTDPAEI
ncbi:hypothetical protein LCGC14_2608360, partial [marine sediment metagenome]